MSHPSASAALLPFGSLTGVMPIDAVPRSRVLGDFSSILGRERLAAEFPATPVPAGSRPACAAWPPSLRLKESGGI